MTSDVVILSHLPRYGIAPNGRVYSFISNKWLSIKSRTTGGYLTVTLRIAPGKSGAFPIHRLVADAYVPNPEGLPEVNHIDGNKDNNHYSNLEWVSHEDNMRHAKANGRHPHGVSHPLSRLTDTDIERVRDMYRCGAAQKVIGALFGVGQQAISKIVNKHRWTHV